MVVPEGWEVLPIKDITETIVSGGTPSTFIQEYWNGDIPWMSSGELNLKRIYTVRKKITQKGLNNSATLFIPRGCILIGLAGQGRTRGTAGINYIPLCINQSIAAIFPNPTRFVSEYLYQYLNSKYDELRTLSMGNGGRGGLNLSIIGNLTILLPPLPEQRRIAEVLSDTDLYITTLERLIAKKEAVKQGTMQELLTGKRHLSGFKGEWVEKTIEQLVERFATGLNPRQNFTLNTGGINYYVTIKNFFNGVLYLDEECDKIDDSALALINTRSDLQKGDILFSSIGRIGDSYLIQETPKNWNINESVFALRPNKSIITSAFLYYLLRSTGFQQSLSINSTGSTLTSIKMGHLKHVTLSIPPTLAEQTTIAEILSDMDAELSALKKKLEKIRLIKQGMMDALLTGKIRLPEDKPNVQFTQRKEQEEILYAAEKTEEYTANHKKRNKHIDDAVMIAGIVNELYSQKYPLGRKKVQKCLYLLRRHQKRSTTEFKKKAAGPYADEIRYRGGEPIALSAQYIITQKGTKGTLFFKGTNIQQALNYIEQWNMQTDIQWLRERLKFKSVDTLELWATVDMAICDLENMQMPISLSSIKHLIATNEEWKKKLEKPLFNDANIIKAISELRTLFEYKSK